MKYKEMIGYHSISTGMVNVYIESLSPSEYKKIKSDLIIRNVSCVPDRSVAQKVDEALLFRPIYTITHLHQEKDFCVQIPRAYAMGTSCLLNRIDIDEWENLFKLRKINHLNIYMKTPLHTEQTKAMEDVIRCVQKVYGACICAPCGFGKTVVALAIICNLHMCTLIIVNTQSMVQQWKSRIAEHVGGNIDESIEICTIQAFLYSRTPCRIKQTPGLIIVDEAHFLPAPIYRDVLSSSPIYLGCCYRIALTATPEREDNEHKWLYTHFGPIAFRGQPRIINGSACIIKRECSAFKGLEYMQIMGIISRNTSRNELIIKCILHALVQRRAILILSLYVSQLSELQRMWLVTCEQMQTESPYIYTMYGNSRTIPEDGTIISPSITFATYALAKQGLDCKKLNTLILALPCKNITQPIGRIMRTEHKNGAYVYDIHDTIPMCTGGQLLRKQYYQKLQWSTKEIQSFLI
jgi:superfamily II DNA or RNA helicase